MKRRTEEAYEHRVMPGGTLDPDRLAVLADALFDTGCTDPGIFAHLREPGPHWRGCHVADLLLAGQWETLRTEGETLRANRGPGVHVGGCFAVDAGLGLPWLGGTAAGPRIFCAGNVCTLGSGLTSG